MSSPLVSVGVPIFNEESYIRQTLDSLLSQDYENLELIISDNASTDGTSAICQEISEKDRRVRYIRAETNEGAIKNFNNAFYHSSGTYFMWAGGHDLWASSFISRAVSLLESDSSVILAYPETMLIDAAGQKVRKVPDEMDTRDMASVDRYLKFISRVHWCNMIHGLFRSEVIRNSGMFRSVWGPDILLLAELSLRGEFAQIPEILFYRRENRPDEQRATEAESTKRYLATLEGVNGKAVDDQVLDKWTDLRAAILRTVKESELNLPDKLNAYVRTMICFRVRYGVPFPGDFLMLNVRRLSQALKAH